jgi:phosphonate transport system substrate-binding protein
MPTRRLRAITFLAPNMRPVYEFIVGTIGQQLDLEAELITGTHYEQVFEADLAFICGLPYVLRTPPRLSPAPLAAIAAPVLKEDRYQNRPIYFSDVIVRHDSAFQSFEDLRGTRWAYNEPESQSGYGITRYHLARRGETSGYFGQTIKAGFHQRAIRLVCDGVADAAAIDSQVLAIELRDHPELSDQLRVIDALGPSTIQPITAATHLPSGLIADLQGVLAELHQQQRAAEWLDRGLIDHFAAVDDHDYDDIRMMLTACEQAGFLQLR